MPAARSEFRKHRVASFLLAALFVVATTVSLLATWDRFDEILHGDRYVSPSFDLNTQTFKVDQLEPQAEQAGLRKGDIVVGVNGRPIQGWSDIYVPVRRARTGDHLLLRVKHTGAAGSIEQDIPVPLRRFTHVGYTPRSAATLSSFFSAF